MARTGTRLGEAIGLEWADIDMERREVRVERSITDGLEGTPKSGKSRRVDMSAALRDMLQKHRVSCMATMLERGWGELPEWIFFTEAGTPLDRSAVGKALRALLRPAKLPAHFSTLTACATRSPASCCRAA